MISQILFFIAAVCLIIVVVVLLIMLANQVRADDTNDDIYWCYDRWYADACDRLDKLQIEKIMNETRELWK